MQEAKSVDGVSESRFQNDVFNAPQLGYYHQPQERNFGLSYYYASYDQGSAPYYSNYVTHNQPQFYYQGHFDSFMQQDLSRSWQSNGSSMHMSDSTNYDQNAAASYQAFPATTMTYPHSLTMAQKQQRHWPRQNSGASEASTASSYDTSSRNTTVSPSGNHRNSQRTVKPMIQRCGPPMTPKQSGWALWVGNLPPGVAVIDIKDVFAQGFKDTIQSIRLISRSNCAFVNYSNEASSVAAVQRFDGARMLGFRLSTRIKNMTANRPEQDKPFRGLDPVHSGPPTNSQNAQVDDVTKAFGKQNLKSENDRYFILKSVTEQDIESSIKDGYWSTQLHNEAKLNQAYQTADYVFLIFSVNHSGEYAGYARMTSEVRQDEVAQIDDTPPNEQAMQAKIANRPRSYVCAGTEWAPPGRIVVDEARSTIFWEVSAPADTKPQTPDKFNGVEANGNTSSGPTSTGGTSSFKVEWASTQHLPFHRVRDLRNSLNSNLNVKIARDGQEVDPRIGKLLIDMFGRASEQQ